MKIFLREKEMLRLKLTQLSEKKLLMYDIIILKFIINKQLSVGRFSLYSFALLKNMGALLKSAWLNDRLCYN